MRKIITSAFVSLDGVMQAPGGPEEDPTGGFKFGGWTAPYWDEVMGAVMDEAFAAPFDLLLGRKTYDIFAAHWPHLDVDPKTSTYDPGEIEIAKLFNRVPKYVATHSPATLTWQNSQSLGSDVVASLRDLKKKDGPTLLVQGSSNLTQTLLAHDLIDEFRLLIFPLVLGKGKRLFGTGTLPVAFKLTNGRPDRRLRALRRHQDRVLRPRHPVRRRDQAAQQPHLGKSKGGPDLPAGSCQLSKWRSR